MEENLTNNTRWRSIWIANIVAFIGSVQSSALVPTVWPYLKRVDIKASENLYGFVRGLFALGQTLFCIVSGYLSNRIGDTKPAMIIGKILVVVAVIFYCLIGIFPLAYVYMFIAFEFIFGVASGFASVYRTHIAMASTENDRVKAYGSTQLCNAVGLIIGPVLQLLLSRISYPGLEILPDLYLNMYTAPAWVAGIISIIGVILMIFLFNGKYSHYTNKNNEKKENNEFDEIELTKHNTTNNNSSFSMNNNDENEINIPYNIIGICVLIYTKVVCELVMLNLATIVPPYTMTAFQWSSEQAIVIQSVLMGSVGILIILFSSAYVFLKLGNLLSERFSIFVGIFCMLIFHILTYPWSFYGHSIEYMHEKGSSPPMNLSMALSDNALQQLISNAMLPNSTIEIVGCNLEYKWCETTPKINFPIFSISVIITMGMGFPLTLINLDCLYSKVLGPIKQGTLQGIFIGVAQIMNIFGPMLFAKLYTAYGPKIVWLIEIIACLLNLALLLLFYKKLISWDGKKSNSRVSSRATITPMELKLE